MRRIFLIYLIMILLCVTACSSQVDSAQLDTYLPDNKQPPVRGSWVVKQYIGEGYSNRTTRDFPLGIGDSCLFHYDAVVIGSGHVLNPIFRARLVKSSEYLMKKYRVNASDLGIHNEKILVINIMDHDNEFAELFYGDDGCLFIPADEGFYELDQLAPEVSLDEVYRFITVEENINRDVKSQRKNSLKTGLWFGTRSLVEDEGHVNWEYRTYYLVVENGKVKDWYSLDGLLVPRKNGFWHLQASRIKEPGQIRDELTIYPDMEYAELDKDEAFNKEGRSLDIPLSDKEGLEDDYELKMISFVGNDFLSIERNVAGWKSRGIYALDNLDSDYPVKLSDLDEDGRNRFIQSEQRYLPEGVAPLGKDENLGIIRDKGYWTLIGRTYYLKDGQEVTQDFPINMAVPQDMVTFDQSLFPWSELSVLLPGIKDGLSSPNQEFLLALGNQSMGFYEVKDLKIDKQAQVEIDLAKQMDIIMVEWALDGYVDKWEEVMIKKGASSVLVKE